jgi:hypothetical protein
LTDIFYSSAVNYLTARADRNIDAGPTDFEVKGLHALFQIPVELLKKNIRIRDERSSTIEIQVGEPVMIKNNIIGLVIPQRIAGLESTIDVINRWSPKHIRYYEPVYGLHSDSIYGEVYSHVRDIYKEIGLV